MKSRHVEDG